MGSAAAVPSRPWWQTAVFYQIYPRSFADANQDGIGDLAGIINHLDYLEWLGVGGLWLNPITPSPNADWGYDVADYCDIDPQLGTLDDFDRLVVESGKRDIRIVLDIVPNHTSDQHHWFRDALSGRSSAYRDHYVWSDPRSDGSPPNNWLSLFGGPAWTYHEPTGQFYLHNFLAQQPDLNWWNADVRREFEEIFRFWLDRGVAGFRIDVAQALVKDRELRDNDPLAADDHWHQRLAGQRLTRSMNHPEVHEIYRAWRRWGDARDPQPILIGETFVYDIARWASFYGRGTDELHLAFNFPFVLGEFDVGRLRDVVSQSEAALPVGAWPVWMMSNHDIGRVMSRWCDGDEIRCRAAMMLLMTLRGTPFLYFGEEIGLSDTPLDRDQLRDPVGIQHWPASRGRDGCRTPMPWNAERGGGFTTGGAEPWLPYGDYRARNVEAQASDPESMLTYTRALIALRRASDDLTAGAYAEVAPTPRNVWAFRRGTSTLIAINLGDDPAEVGEVWGTVRLSTDGVVAERCAGSLKLAPWQGVIVSEDR